MNPEEQGHKAPASEDGYDYNKQHRPKDASGNPLMENVDFQGVREVEVEATEEMKRLLRLWLITMQIHPNIKQDQSLSLLWIIAN